MNEIATTAMTSKEWIIAAVFVVCLQFCVGQDPRSFNWCDPILNCGPQKNSMCIMTRKENTNDCFFMENVMTAEDKRLLLAMHNSIRDQVAAGDIDGWQSASDMRLMSWDDTLAAQATLWAFQCNYTSDPCPRHPYYPRVGQAAVEVGDTNDFQGVQSVFKMMVNTGKAGAKLVDRWDSKNDKDGYRNFHQIVNARQTAVGCGLVRYLKTKKGTGGKNIAVFSLSLWCNYGVGLQSGEKIYTKGDPCNSCPDKTKCRAESTYPHLCAASEDPLYGTFLNLNPRSDCQRLSPTAFLIFFSMVLTMKWNFAMKN